MNKIGGAPLIHKRHLDHLTAVRAHKAFFRLHPAYRRIAVVSVSGMLF